MFQKFSSFLINCLSVTLISAITILLYYFPVRERGLFLYRNIYEVGRQKKNKSIEIDHVKFLPAVHNDITETSSPSPWFLQRFITKSFTLPLPIKHYVTVEWNAIFSWTLLFRRKY